MLWDKKQRENKIHRRGQRFEGESIYCPQNCPEPCDHRYQLQGVSAGMEVSLYVLCFYVCHAASSVAGVILGPASSASWHEKIPLNG